MGGVGLRTKRDGDSVSLDGVPFEFLLGLTHEGGSSSGPSPLEPELVAVAMASAAFGTGLTLGLGGVRCHRLPFKSGQKAIRLNRSVNGQNSQKQASFGGPDGRVGERG